MKKVLTMAVLALFVFGLACSSNNDDPTDVPGSGNIITEARQVSGYSSIKLLGPGLLTIDLSGSESLSITADENLMQYITSEVTSNQLVIGIEDAINALPTVPIVYTLTAKTMSELLVVGNSAVEFFNVDTDSLYAVLDGNGRISLAGATSYQNIDVRLTGTYDALQLTSDITYATVRGTAFGDLNVSDSLYATVLDCGRIEFTGGADLVNIFVSECGSVKRK